jgi:hypothetical protein
MADRDAAIEEIQKTAYAIGMPHDERFRFISLIQMTNDELHRARLDVLVEQINWCYKRIGFLAS